jgi:hypothetical protein
VIKRVGLAFALLLLLGSTGAMAQQSAVRQACAAEIKRLCGEVQPGDGRLRGCVREHFAQLPEPCKQALLSSVAVVKICKADVERTCANVEPGGGRIQACIKDHFREYSEPCREALLLAKLGTR